MKWISVKDRLPDNIEDLGSSICCIVWINNVHDKYDGEVALARYCYKESRWFHVECKHVFCKNEVTKNYDDCLISKCRLSVDEKVTHWMPLPKGPKDGN